jgi:hypothetical protein
VTAKDVKKQPGITIRPAPTGQETKASDKAPQTSSSGGKSNTPTLIFSTPAKNDQLSSPGGKPNAPTLVFGSSQSSKGQTKKPFSVRPATQDTTNPKQGRLVFKPKGASGHSGSPNGETKKPNDKNDAAMAQQVKKSRALLVDFNWPLPDLRGPNIILEEPSGL